MITKVQGKTVSGELSVKARPRLNALEKASLNGLWWTRRTGCWTRAWAGV